MAAFYAAEAGMTRVVHEFRQIYEDSSIRHEDIASRLMGVRDYFRTTPIIALTDNNGETASARVSFEIFNLDRNAAVLKATIVSTGRVGDSARVLRKDIEFSYGEVESFQMKYGVLVSHTITASGTITSTDPNNPPRIATAQSETIPSPINIQGLNQKLNRRLDFPDVEVEVEVTYETKAAFPIINFIPIRAAANGLFPLSQTTFTHHSLINALMSGNELRGGNYFINHLDFGSVARAGIREIRVSAGQRVFIVTNMMTLGSVTFVGDGHVVIYVRAGARNFLPNDNGTDFGRLSEEEKLAVHIDTMSGVANNAYHVIFPNNSKVRGYFMFENARILFKQNSELWGGLFTGAQNGTRGVDAITIENNAWLSANGGRSLLVAPSGRVLFNNNSGIIGAVIARDFFQPKNASMIFDPDASTSIPFELTFSNSTGPGSGSSAGRSFTTSATVER